METKWKTALIESDMAELAEAEFLRDEARQLKLDAARIVKRVQVRCQQRLARKARKAARLVASS